MDRKKVLERCLAIVATVVMLALIHLRNGASLEVTFIAVEYGFMLSTMSMALTDVIHKCIWERELVNWQELVGVLSVLGGAWMLGRFIFSESAIGFVWLGISVFLYVAGVVWFGTVYAWSVMSDVAYEWHLRHTYANRIERAVEAGKKATVRKYLGIVCHFYCDRHDYKTGPMEDQPFDSKKGRNYLRLKKAKTDEERAVARKVYTEIDAMAGQLVQEGYNGEDVRNYETAKELARKEG